MKFKMPESLDGLSIEQLDELHKAAFEEYAGLTMKDDADVTDVDLADLDALNEHLDVIETAKATAEAAAQERAEKLASARARVAEDSTPAEDPEPDPEEGEEDEDGDEPDEDTQPDEAEAEKEKELVTASARRTVRKAASKTPAPSDVIPDDRPAGRGLIIASANVPDFSAGAELADMSELTKAFMARSRMLIGRRDKATMERYGVAKIKRPENEFTIGKSMTVAEQLAVIDYAASEKRLPGASLTAAGGWCAPSETLYDFCENETAVNLFGLPEVTLTHGGVNFTSGPQLTDLLADPNFGWEMTEAEAEAGTVEKTCFEFECPDFTDHRLEAFGYCFKAPILTASPAGWPELIQRFLNLSTIGWQYKQSARMAAAVSAALGAAINFTEIGGAVADSLDAISLNASIIRQEQFLGDTATIEVTLPTWAREVFRSDWSRRTGVENGPALSDAQINSWFSVRHLSVSYVNGFQPLATTGAAWPTTLEAWLYPAGTYVWGNNDVIQLDSVYDSAGLAENMYTAVFFEEAGVLINRCGSGKKVAIDISCLKGVTGAAELSCIPVGP